VEGQRFTGPAASFTGGENGAIDPPWPGTRIRSDPTTIREDWTSRHLTRTVDIVSGRKEYFVLL
jgi:hypothetical protein